MISVQTRRYSLFFGRLIEHYHQEGATILIDDHRYQAQDFDELIEKWCHNRTIMRSRDFELIFLGRAIAGFHDGPENMWVAVSEEPFIKAMADEKLIRYEILPMR